jgi:F-type H+-transporting ATPase subunit d
LPLPRCLPARNGTPIYSSRKLTSTLLQRSAALKLDWTKIGTQLGLKGNTAAALQSFKKRNDDARRKVTVLSEQAQTVDFQHYRSILKNQAIVDDIEKQFSAFKPQTYDVSRQIKAIEAFEAQALQSAEQTKSVVDKELSDLEKTLKNIEEARPFSDLTVVRTHWERSRWRWRWMLMDPTGRGCSCSARHRQAHRAARFQGPLGRSWLQGKSCAMEPGNWDGC